MNTIPSTSGIQPTGPQVQEQVTARPTDVGQVAPGTDHSPSESLVASGVQAPAPRPDAGHEYLDPDRMREFMARVADAIREASVEPHVVGFRPDPDSGGYLIEIRRPDGTLVTSFAPEKVLNLNGNRDDLAGMVIDRKS